jgi:ABC-type branched-subunit amino acid transport system ATPase component
MRIVLEICSQLYVLAEGRVIAEGATATVRNDPKVLEAYF